MSSLVRRDPRSCGRFVLGTRVRNGDFNRCYGSFECGTPRGQRGCLGLPIYCSLGPGRQCFSMDAFGTATTIALEPNSPQPTLLFGPRRSRVIAAATDVRPP